jgi:transposase
MLAELVDAVVGVDTHRDTHQAEIALPSGAPIATCSIGNDSAGHAELLAWIVEHAPGPRLVVSIEGTRSYGRGVARAATAAGLLVLECEQPARAARRGRGKSDRIDAHLAVLAALRLDADRLPVPRVDGDREALRILLGARDELTVTSTAQINRLRALLGGGDDTDARLARGALPEATLAGLARRRQPRGASCEQAVRHAEIRRLALAVTDARRALKANRAQLRAIVDRLAPGLVDRRGVGPVTAAQAIVSFSHPGPLPQRRCVRRPRRHQPAAGQQRPDGAPPAQPRRRPGAEPGAARHRHGQDAQLSPHPGLRRPPPGRRQDHQGDPALSEALHRPRALPHPHRHPDHGGGLTNIEASFMVRTGARWTVLAATGRSPGRGDAGSSAGRPGREFSWARLATSAGQEAGSGRGWADSSACPPSWRRRRATSSSSARGGTVLARLP